MQEDGGEGSHDQLVVAYALYLLMHENQSRMRRRVWLLGLFLLLVLLAIVLGFDYVFTICYSQALLSVNYAGRS